MGYLFRPAELAVQRCEILDMRLYNIHHADSYGFVREILSYEFPLSIGEERIYT